MDSLIIVLCVAGVVLSIKSMMVLGAHAPWTSAGWALTIAYCIVLYVQIARHVVLAWHAEYLVLVALTVAFIIAGVRDEPQAEIWWWPTRRGATRAQKRLITETD